MACAAMTTLTVRAASYIECLARSLSCCNRQALRVIRWFNLLPLLETRSVPPTLARQTFAPQERLHP
jgi:hypothetical protein